MGMGKYLKYSLMLQSMNPNTMKRTLRDNWFEVVTEVKANGLDAEFLKSVNRLFKTHFTSMDQLSFRSRKVLKESEILNENVITTFWGFFQNSVLPNIDIKQTVFRSIEQTLVKTAMENAAMAAVYTVMWLIVSISAILEEYIENTENPSIIMVVLDKLFRSLAWLHPATHYRKYKAKFRKGKDGEIVATIESKQFLIEKYLE